MAYLARSRRRSGHWSAFNGGDEAWENPAVWRSRHCNPSWNSGHDSVLIYMSNSTRYNETEDFN